MKINGIELLGRAGEACPYCGLVLYKTTWYGKPYDGLYCLICNIDFCPHCGSDEIVSGHIQGLPGEYVEVVECRVCGARLLEEGVESSDERCWMVCEIPCSSGKNEFCIGRCYDPCPHVLVHGMELTEKEAFNLLAELERE